MRNEAEFGDSNRNGSKANGSDSAESAVEQQSSGNGLVDQYSKITDPKVLATGGGGDKPDAATTATSPESGSGIKTDAGLVGSGSPATSSMDSGNDASAAKSKPDGSAKQSPAGEFGKYKSTGVGAAFPSSAELLKGLT